MIVYLVSKLQQGNLFLIVHARMAFFKRKVIYHVPNVILSNALLVLKVQIIVKFVQILLEKIHQLVHAYQDFMKIILILNVHVIFFL